MNTYGITVTLFNPRKWEKNIRSFEKGFTSAEEALSKAGSLFNQSITKSVHVHPESGEKAGQTILWLNKDNTGKCIKREYNPI